MSGPYRYLTEEDIRELERQRVEEELRRKRRAELLLVIQLGYRECESFDVIQWKCDSVISQLKTIPISMDTHKIEEQVKEIHNTIIATKKEWDDETASEGLTSDELRQKTEKVTTMVARIKQIIDEQSNIIDDLSKETRLLQVSHYDHVLKSCTARSIHQIDDSVEKKSNSALLDDAYREKYHMEETRLYSIVKCLKERANSVGLDCHPLIETEIKMMDLKKSALSESEKIRELHTIDIRCVQVFEDRLEQVEREISELDSKLSRELADYHALCSEFGIEPQEFPFEEASVVSIRKACNELLAQEEWVLKRRYVLGKIQYYLKEKGYTFVGEKQEKTMFVRQVYRINKEMVFHITFDEEGQVTIEIAKMDTIDRQPDNDEIEHIVSTQHASCEEIEEMFDALNELGVRATPVFAYHGGTGFAQVINVSGFSKGDKTEIAKAITKKYKARKRKYKYMEA